jgi:hypothetical protein
MVFRPYVLIVNRVQVIVITSSQIMEWIVFRVHGIPWLVPAAPEIMPYLAFCTTVTCIFSSASSHQHSPPSIAYLKIKNQSCFER